MRSAVDTNVISALWSRKEPSAAAEKLLLDAYRKGSLVICGIVYAELIAHPAVKPNFVDEFLRQSGIAVEVDTNLELWRESGTRFAKYAARRARSGAGKSRRLLPDFIIGVHALNRADRLLTFNGEDFKIDFPDLILAENSS